MPGEEKNHGQTENLSIEFNLLLKVILLLSALGLGAITAVRLIAPDDTQGLYLVTVENSEHYVFTIIVDVENGGCWEYFDQKPDEHDEHDGYKHQFAGMTVVSSNDESFYTIKDEFGTSHEISSAQIEFALQEAGYPTSIVMGPPITDLKTGETILMINAFPQTDNQDAGVRDTVVAVRITDGTLILTDLRQLVQDAEGLSLSTQDSFPGLLWGTSRSSQPSEYYYVTSEDGQLRLVKTDIMDRHLTYELKGIRFTISGIGTTPEGAVLMITGQEPLNQVSDAQPHLTLERYELELSDGTLRLITEQPIEINELWPISRFNSWVYNPKENAFYTAINSQGVYQVTASGTPSLVKSVNDRGFTGGGLEVFDGIVIGETLPWKSGGENQVEMFQGGELVCLFRHDESTGFVYDVNPVSIGQEFPFLSVVLTLLFLLSSLASLKRGSTDKTPR